VGELLTIKEVGSRLGVHENTVRRMLPALGAVDIARPGAGRRTLRIPEASLERFIRQGEVVDVGQDRRAAAADWRIPRKRPGV